MVHDAILMRDVRIGMRRLGIMEIEEVECMVLEAAGGFTCVTRAKVEQWRERGGKGIPGCLQGCVEYEKLVAEDEDSDAGEPNRNKRYRTEEC